MNFSLIFSRLVPFFCLALLLASCGDNGANTARQDRAVPVVTAKAVKRDVPRTLTAVGNVQPAASVAVKPQVGGQIVAVPVSSGQDVAKGQVLFQIDPRPYEANVREVQARLLRNQVLLKKAEEDKARFSRLVKQDAVSREQYDQAVTNAASQRAAVAQDEAALTSARLQLEYATIKAPVSGRVGEVLIDAGNVVKANDDRTLLVINTLAPAKIRFAVPERHLPEILRQHKAGAIPVTALPEGDTREAAVGRLSSVDNTVDQTTGTIRLEATFDNTDHRLWPGQFVRITVDLATISGALVIPSAAVLEGVIGQYVYVADADKTASVRRVMSWNASETEAVVEKGLNEGEKVITDGQLNLAPGLKIVEKPPVPSLNARETASGNSTAKETRKR